MAETLPEMGKILQVYQAVAQLRIKNVTQFFFTPKMKEMTDAFTNLKWPLTEEVVRNLPIDPAWVEKHEKSLVQNGDLPLDVVRGFEIPHPDTSSSRSMQKHI